MDLRFDTMKISIFGINHCQLISKMLTECHVKLNLVSLQPGIKENFEKIELYFLYKSYLECVKNRYYSLNKINSYITATQI